VQQIISKNLARNLFTNEDTIHSLNSKVITHQTIFGLPFSMISMISPTSYKKIGICLKSNPSYKQLVQI